MRRKINKRQMIQCELMEHVNLDRFDSQHVISDLVMMPDPSWGLLPLRDLGESNTLSR